jgi:cysteine-rich repeat protein
VKIQSPRARHERVSTRVAVAACSFALFACSDPSQSPSRAPSTHHQGADASAELDGSADGSAARKDGGHNGSHDTPESGAAAPDQLVIFDFTGVVDAISPLTDALPFPASVGDELRGVYAFNPSKARAPGSGLVGSYQFDNVAGEFELHLDVGDVGVVSALLDASLVQSTISVGDDVESTNGGLTDSYDLEVMQATAPGFFGQAIDFTLRLASNKDLGVVRGTSLPLDPPDVSRFDDASFIMHVAGAEVRGHATGVTRSTSTVNAGVCGDGILNFGEECDDFNDRDGDGCDSCRFSCIAGNPDRGCDTGDACNGPATCLAATHTCVAGPERANFTRCDEGRVCWEGVCASVDAEPSRFATFTFKAYVSEIEAPVITVPPPGILFADSINGSFTLDVTAAPAAKSSTKSEFKYVNEPGAFALYATVGPLHLQASKLDASPAGSTVRVTPDGYDVTAGQLVAIGSPVAPATLAITLTDPQAALSPSSPLALASTQFAGGTAVLTYGGLVLHANVSSIKRTAGGTAPSPAPAGGNDGGTGPLPPLDGGNIVISKDGGNVVIGKDAGTPPMPPPDSGSGTTSTP